MINVDERLDEAYLNTVYSGNSAPHGIIFAINLNNDSVYQSLKADIKHLFADYIESIELPSKGLPPQKVLEDDHIRGWFAGQEDTLRWCQAKLDEAVKTLKENK